jgi:hypothetical protein
MAKEILLSIIDLEVKDNLVIIRFPPQRRLRAGQPPICPPSSCAVAGPHRRGPEERHGRVFISGLNRRRAELRPNVSGPTGIFPRHAPSRSRIIC